MRLSFELTLSYDAQSRSDIGQILKLLEKPTKYGFQNKGSGSGVGLAGGGGLYRGVGLY